jgi:hypothetical protein
MFDSSRFLEEAADELGRLEAIVSYAPPATSTALRLACINQLARLDADAGSSTISASRLDTRFAALAAAEGDPLHDAELPAAALHWRTLIETEERRVRGGAPLASQRFAIVAPALATYSDRARLEAIWRESGLGRPVLVRALDAAAWSPTLALGEASAALMLCAGGRTDRVRLLPFAESSAFAEAREAAVSAWRDGDAGPWTQLGLSSVARRARAIRSAIERLLRSLGEEEARLDSLGRAAINARRALALLRERFVTTMPLLAEELSLSRPAASDALDRLAAAGLAREMTGRARDRVYAWGAACSVAVAADAPTAS